VICEGVERYFRTPTNTDFPPPIGTSVFFCDANFIGRDLSDRFKVESHGHVFRLWSDLEGSCVQEGDFHSRLEMEGIWFIDKSCFIDWLLANDWEELPDYV
jgi:hypothetical protein